jgi:hypothetical protein
MIHVVYAGIIYCALVGAIWPRRTYDIWWHLATGKHILETGELPRRDIFTYTRQGHPWIAHEWAWEIAMYTLYRAWGFAGLLALKVTVAVAAAALLAWLCFRRGAREIPVLMVAIVAVFAAAPLFNVRPQVSGILLLTIMLCLIELARSASARWLLLSPLVMVVWVNVHGGFIFGPAVLFLFLLSLIPEWYRQRRQRLALEPAPLIVVASLALALAACLVNPNGLAGATYPLEYVVGEHAWHKAVITEYSSPDFSMPIFLYLEMLILLVVLCFALSRRQARLLDVVLVLAFLHITLKWERNTALFAFVAAPVAAEHLSGLLEDSGILRRDRASRRRAEPQLLYWLIILALLGGAIASAPAALRKVETTFAQDFPVEAVQVAQRAHLQGNMFNTYRWGGYLIWKLWPEHRVFIDGRADVMGRELMNDFRCAHKLEPGWREVLDKHDVQWVIISAKSPLCRALRLDPDFRLLHADENAELFVRQEAGNEP